MKSSFRKLAYNRSVKASWSLRISKYCRQRNVARKGVLETATFLCSSVGMFKSGGYNGGI
jgi:hypothetical protein